MINVLNIQDSKDGTRLKQGDRSTLRFVLSDSNGDDLELYGQSANIYLYNNSEVVFKDTVEVDYDRELNYVVDIVINTIVPAGEYMLEVIVGNKYVFPSDKSTRIEIVESVLGKFLGQESETYNIFDELLDYAASTGKLDVLKGEQGEALKFDDLTEQQKAQLRGEVGPKGDPFVYDDVSKIISEFMVANRELFKGTDGRDTLVVSPTQPTNADVWFEVVE